MIQDSKPQEFRIEFRGKSDGLLNGAFAELSAIQTYENALNHDSLFEENDNKAAGWRFVLSRISDWFPCNLTLIRESSIAKNRAKGQFQDSPSSEHV